MFGNNNSNNKNKITKSRWFNEKGEHDVTLEHIRGNAAIGEQVHSVRKFRADKPMTFEEMKLHWDEMNQEAKEWLDNNPGQSANFITSQDTNGNAIIQVVPAKDLIFSGSNLVAIYDGNGNQIVGKDNIIREVQRRRAERDEWIREGKIENIFDEIHHTDDGWTSHVKFTAYPNKLHPKEVEAETDQLIRLATEKRKKQLGIGDDRELSESISEISVDDTSNKKPRIGEKENTTPMDIDQSETQTNTSTNKVQESSLTETGFKLPSDSEIEAKSRDELVSLTKQMRDILEKKLNEETKQSQDSNASNYKVSGQELKDAISKAESRMQVLDNSSVSNNDTLNNSNTGGILATVAVFSTLAIGGIALMKSKLGKVKKK